MNQIIFKYIATLTNDELENSPVIACRDEEGKLCIFIRNSKHKTISSTIKTDYLECKSNSIYCANGKEFYFHRIVCMKSDVFSNEQFQIVYEYLFKEIKNPLDDSETFKLFNSLSDLFRVTPEKEDKAKLIGLYGELLFVKYIYDNGGTNIFQKYHKDFYSKHDIEINDKIRFEIKTTVGSSRIHNFRHDQLVRSDVTVFVGSVLLEESEQGLSIYELLESIINSSNDAKVMIDFGKIKASLGLSKENPGIKFSYEVGLSNIKIYKASDLPHLENCNVNGVTNISYKVDCSLSKELDAKIILEYINN